MAPDTCISLPKNQESAAAAAALLLQFASTYALVNFKKVSVAGFQHIYRVGQKNWHNVFYVDNFVIY